MVGSRGKLSLSSGFPETIHYSSATGLGPLLKLTDYGSNGSGRLLVARQTVGKASMTENNWLATSEAPQSGSRKSQMIPVVLLCALVLAAAVNLARGKNNETFEGVVVMDYTNYRFYQDQKDCHVKGTAYWLVPNDRFYDVVSQPRTSDSAHLDRLFHAAWKAKLRGNLSSIGHYGFEGKYWRELDVLYVIDATQLECTDENAGSLR
jgi:hypothetical protein